jgi:hypothetical protein
MAQGEAFRRFEIRSRQRRSQALGERVGGGQCVGGRHGEPWRLDSQSIAAERYSCATQELIEADSVLLALHA